VTRDERAPAEFPEGEKHPDCRDVRPFAGAGETGISAGRSRGRRLQPPGKWPSGDARGARTAKEEGSLPQASRASARGDLVARLRSGRSAHAHTPSSLDHPRRNRRWNRAVASHATARRAVAFDAPLRDGLRRRGAAPTVRAWLAACSPLERGGLSHAAGAERREAGSGGRAAAQGGNALAPAAGEDRRLEFALARRSSKVAEVDGPCSAQRSGHLSITRWGSGRGRAPPHAAHRAKAQAPRAKEARLDGSKRKPHVTAHRDRRSPRQARGPSREVAPDRSRQASLHGTPARRSRLLGRMAPREIAGRCPRATGATEARWSGSARTQDAARQPATPAEADRATVNRPVPQPPPVRAQASIGGARRKPRRDAGSRRGAGARRRSSGKQKSVGSIVLVLRGLPQGSAQEDGLARRKPFVR